jgi:hypothetical protein
MTSCVPLSIAMALKDSMIISVATNPGMIENVRKFGYL